MNREDVKDFFNSLAAGWDSGMVCDDRIINKILDNCHVTENADVLDVACGTGVLIPYYLSRKVRRVTAIDIADAMTEIAERKFAGIANVRIMCGDVLEYRNDTLFDCIVLYNALPHFPDDKQLIEKLAGMLKKGGCLTLAHGMSRDRINSHHINVSCTVKKELKPAGELADIMSGCLKVETVISDDDMYQVTGVRE